MRWVGNANEIDTNNIEIIYMAMEPNRHIRNANYIPPAHAGHVLALGWPGFTLGPSGFALGPPDFLDTNMSVSARLGGLEQCVGSLEGLRIVVEYRL